MNLQHPQDALKTYQTIRSVTESICSPLEIEDYVVQGMEDVSPAKWHIAHVTWFFETLILIPYFKQYAIYNPHFHALFNSYYQTLGTPYPRPHRGCLSRPGVAEIFAYRSYVDQKIAELLHHGSESIYLKIQDLLILGLHHEQQHQELLLMDIKYNLSLHPHFPAYKKEEYPEDTGKPALHLEKEKFIYFPAGMTEIGFNANGFCFDNEKPAHPCFIQSFGLASRLITNAEYLAFIDAGGYTNPIYWLADGWDWLQKTNRQAPLYWHQLEKEWYLFTLHGLKKLSQEQPVCHVSYYEAQAFAHWQGKRLPTEVEWEHAANTLNAPLEGNFLESGYLHPQSSSVNNEHLQQLFGDVWEWTSSPYAPYPGYQPFKGALAEYNSKFMCNQLILRGGGCVTPLSHMRKSYRNFFQADKQWFFGGIRLACDGE